MTDGLPKNFSVGPNVSDEFKGWIFDQYNKLPAPIRAGLDNYNGTSTRIILESKNHRFKKDGNQSYQGLTESPSNLSRYTPLEQRSFMRWQSPNIYITEYSGADQSLSRNSEEVARETLVHEIGHRVAAAVVGNNYAKGPLRTITAANGYDFSRGPGLLGSEFNKSYMQDLANAGWPEKNVAVWKYILPERNPSGSVNMDEINRAAQEGFAEIFAHLYSQTRGPDNQPDLGTSKNWTKPVASFAPADYTDFGIFKNSAKLVASATDYFAGEHVRPFNPVPGQNLDYVPPSLSDPRNVPAGMNLASKNDPHPGEKPRARPDSTAAKM